MFVLLYSVTIKHNKSDFWLLIRITTQPSDDWMLLITGSSSTNPDGKWPFCPFKAPNHQPFSSLAKMSTRSPVREIIKPVQCFLVLDLLLWSHHSPSFKVNSFSCSGVKLNRTLHFPKLHAVVSSAKNMLQSIFYRFSWKCV